MLRSYASRSFGAKDSSHTGLGQKNKETLKKGVKAGIAVAALVGGIALSSAGVKHATETVRREGSRSDLLQHQVPMKGPIEKSLVEVERPEKPIFVPPPRPLLTPAPAVAPARGGDIAKVAIKGIAGVVAGEGKVGGVVKDVASAVADKGIPEGQNIIDQIRQVESEAAEGRSKVVGADDASVKDLAKIGARKLKGKVPSNPLKKKK